MTLWTASEAAVATGGSLRGDWAVSGVSIDSRSLQAGDLFVALTAARDGHDFVAPALAKGAGAAMVSRIPEGVAADAPLLIVPDVLEALVALGRAARARSSARVAAVTGSVGKTSTKEMLGVMLCGQGRTHLAEASYNNHWGVPLTLARMPRDSEFAVIEIGMSHPGEIAPLAQLARPHVAMITTVAAVHLEAFADVEGIAEEKAAIFDGLEAGGTAVFNDDLPVSGILSAAADAAKAQPIRFGTGDDAAFRLCDTRINANTTVARAEIRGAPLMFKIETAGRHFALNALGALAVVEALGADLAIAAQDIGNWQPYAGRGARETIPLDPVESHLMLTLLDDAYNANPTSLGAALDVLAEAEVSDGVGRVQKGRRIAILGDMKELGPQEAVLHQAVVEHPAIARIDRIHTVGPLMRHLHTALPEAQRGLWCATAAEMAGLVRSNVDAGDVVLVKGSLSMELARVVDAVRKLGHCAAQN